MAAGPAQPLYRLSVPATSPDQVAAALAARIEARPGSLVVVFATSELDPARLAAALDAALAPATVVGCTSIGEIAGPATTGTVACAVADSPHLRFGIGLAPDLARGPLQAGRAAVADALAALGVASDDLDPNRHVAITLLDGHSAFAEGFCLGTAASAPRIQFVGGAASDAGGEAGQSAVFVAGRAHHGAGVVVVLESDLPFDVITSEHMVPTPIRVVVTRADPSTRTLHELDGHPAAPRYEQLIRTLGAEGTLDNVMASWFPFAVYVGDRAYVRSINQVVGTSLRTAAAVDEGAILRIMRPGDLVAQTRAALGTARDRLGELAVVLTFSCYGRHLEAVSRGACAALDDIYASLPVVGFHSFGEQAGPLLVNHTLAALAFGAGDV